MAQWKIKETNVNLDLMSKTLGIDPFLCKLLANRNIRTKNNVIKFLHPREKYLHDSLDLLGMDQAIKFILENKHKKITIYGDYDVDGVCSTTILHKGLSSFNISYYIPHREHEGYGLNKNAITKLFETGTEIILACDNGITAIEEIEYAKSLGIDNVIIDHHEPIVKNGVEVLPDAIIVNPKQHSCQYPFKFMCAAGLSYKFIKELYKFSETDFSKELENQLIIFTAIATLCDVVDLQDENRIIVRLGLELLKDPITNQGLEALVKEKNLVDVHEEAIGFNIGPCINAAGRLETAMLAVELFLCDDSQKAKELAKNINQLNEQRKELTQNAMNMILDNDMAATMANQDKIIVLYQPDIHESVAGIVAGRIKDMMYKPTIIITSGEHDPKGSARSIDGYNIYENLASYRHLFIKFGGHEMAAGLSLPEENIDILRSGLNRDFQESGTILQEIIEIDAELDLDKATYQLTEDIDIMRPFGKANESPVFVSYRVSLHSLRMIEEKNTLIFTFLTPQGRSIKGLCFGRGNIDKFIYMIQSQFDEDLSEAIFNGVLRNVDIKLDIVYYVEMNHYNGLSSVQLKLKDFCHSEREYT